MGSQVQDMHGFQVVNCECNVARQLTTKADIDSFAFFAWLGSKK